MNLIDQTDSTFTTRELERLMVYRAAVAAGFYTDWDDSADRADLVEPADTAGQRSVETGVTPAPPSR